MLATIIIFAVTVAAMFGIVFFKPAVKLGQHSVSVYWCAPLLGAVALLASGLLTFEEAFDGLTAAGAVNPIKILVLFLSMSLISIYLDELGFFRILAAWALKKAGKSATKLFAVMYLTVSILTVFTSNDIIILTFTPFICYFCKHANLDPLPFLLCEFVAANTLSMALIIGNPTNIYLGSYFGLSFGEYLKIMFLPAILSGTAAFVVLRLLFAKRLMSFKPEAVDIPQIALDKNTRAQLYIGLSALIITTVALAVSSYVHVDMWLVALCGFTLMLFAAILFAAVKRASPLALAHTARRAPWELIPFVCSMFLFVLTLDKFSVPQAIAGFLGTKYPTLTYAFASTLAANVCNNIPMSVLFGSVINALPADIAIRAAYATIIGSNVGAYLTPIGALAGIMWLSMLKKNDVKLSFGRFLLYGITVVIPTLLAAVGGLELALLIFDI